VSIYQVNKLCYRALHDKPFREALAREPDATVAALPLTDDERRALLAGEVGRLYEWGASAFLLSHLTRWELFGLTVPLYNQRMRAARDDR
jgi:Aromatic-ring-opening dioxygenase LigAB, LigA subunit